MSRPLSPHLQVYRWQMTSLLSILHRLSGILLVIGLVVATGGLYSLGQGPLCYQYYVKFLGIWPLRIFCYFLIFCLSFHFFNGIRHLFWDIGMGLDLKTAYKTGTLVLFLTLLSSFFIIWVNL